MPAPDTAHVVSIIMLANMFSILLPLGVTSMMTSSHQFLYPPLDLNLGKAHDPQKALALALNENARAERTRIFNKIHFPNIQAINHSNHIVEPSEPNLSVDKMDLIDAWIVKVENELITPAFERNFRSLHVKKVDPVSGGRRKVLANYKNPFTVVYTINTRERLLRIMLGLEMDFEEVSTLIESEIRQWESQLTSVSVELPTNPLDCHLFRQSLSDMVWFGLQRSSGNGDRLNFGNIARIMSIIWKEQPNPSEKFGPMDLAPRLTHSNPLIHVGPQPTRKGKDLQNLHVRKMFEDIGAGRIEREVSGEKMSSSSPVKLVADGGENSNQARGSSIDSLINHFCRDAEPDFGLPSMDTTSGFSEPGSSQTIKDMPAWDTCDHPENLIQSTAEMDHLIEDGFVGNIDIANRPDDRIYSLVSSAYNMMPFHERSLSLESQFHSIINPKGVYTLGETPSANPAESGLSQHEVLNPYALPDWSEDLEKFLFSD